MIVRWLLKNMNGTSVAAEQLRRYPLTWRILGKVFSSIPLFSLAKSLADRRFVSLLQNALKDASEPKQSGTETKDVEMVDADTEDRPSKRKRSDDVSFDIDGQRRPSGCFRTAEAMFEAMRLLLSRLDFKTSSMAKQENHMGAEHIKSLFCSSAEEVKGLIVPALSVCNSVISSFPQREAYEGQENWISIINDIWDLHLQDDGDAVQIATHFANTSISMLGRLTDAPPHEWQLGVNDEVKRRWTQDLKRFLTRNFILPARTAYLNREVLEIIRIAVEKTLVFSALSCPVIFDLVLSAPQLAAGGQVARRENDSWIQAVFSLLVGTLQESRSPHRLVAVRAMMDIALKWDVSLSKESLRSLAKTYALSSGTPEWSLLLLIAKLNADTFIAGDDDSLLKTILDASISDQVWTGAEPDAADFLITLANGYAKGRDLSGFLQKWFQYLTLAEPHIPFESPRYRLWYNERLYQTVSEHLEKTMNTRQILSFLDWLDAQEDGAAQNAALVLILGALSQGIRQDEIVDAVGLRLHDAVLRRRLPSDVNDEVVSNNWIVAQRSVEWATYEQAQRIWTDLAAALRKAFELNGPLDRDSMVEAYKFAASALVANHPGGVHEEQITDQIEVFLDGVYTGLDSTSVTVSGQCAGLVARLEELWGNGFCPRLLR
jgi:nucleolar pre-ribosomal-associated protein 2